MTNLQSVVFYICSFGLSAILYKTYCKHGKKIFLFLAILIPLLVGGLRYHVGTDYDSYYHAFQQKAFIDPGFYVISSFSRLFGDYRLLFFTYNAITLLFVFLGLRNIDVKYRPLAYTCFLFTFYTTSFNAMRQMLAVSIVFFSYKSVVDKKLLRFTLSIALASLFHTTAIFGFVLYPIMNIERKSTKMIIALFALLVALNYQTILNSISSLSFFGHYSLYNDGVSKVDFSNLSFFVDLLTLFYILLSKRKNIRDELFEKHLFIYIIGLIVSLIGFYDPFVKRISLYFSFSSIVLLAYVPFFCKKSKDRLASQVVIVFFVIGKFVIQTYLLGHFGIIPYNFLEF